MDLFITKIPLNEQVTFEDVWSVIRLWLVESPHYGIKEINYCMEEEFSKETSEHTNIFIQNQIIDENRIFACRFENHEESTVWRTDYIFSNKDNTLNIRLSCGLKEYSFSSPNGHKPHIIRILFDRHMIKETYPIPIFDRPVYLRDDDLDICSGIMTGQYITPFPIVYVSYDAFNSSHYAVDCEQLAISLSGQAHVLIEPNKDFALQLKEKTNGINAYNGYIGIYFTGTTYREIISYKGCIENGRINKKAVENAIKVVIRQAILNHFEIDDWSWDKLLSEIHKRKAIAQSKKAVESSDELEKYINHFDKELNDYKDQIKSLRSQLDSKNAQLELLKRRDDEVASIILKKSNVDEFFIDEYKEFLINLLTISKDKIPADTRPYEVLSDILEHNSISDRKTRFEKSLSKALRNKSLEQRRKQLQDLGFTVEKGSHDKIYFHDPKYSFTLANTPSDYRGTENMLSDILKRIDIYKKFF